MVEIQVEYQGKLRCEAKHVDSGATLLTDAPKDNQGEGASFSPTDLVATALGSCMLTLMGIGAKRLEIDLSGAKATVKKEMSADAPRRIEGAAEEHGDDVPRAQEPPSGCADSGRVSVGVSLSLLACAQAERWGEGDFCIRTPADEPPG